MDSVIIWTLFGVYSYSVLERIVGNGEKLKKCAGANIHAGLRRMLLCWRKLAEIRGVESLTLRLFGWL